jgi:hypothetical protein
MDGRKKCFGWIRHHAQAWGRRPVLLIFTCRAPIVGKRTIKFLQRQLCAKLLPLRKESSTLFDPAQLEK